MCGRASKGNRIYHPGVKAPVITKTGQRELVFGYLDTINARSENLDTKWPVIKDNRALLPIDAFYEHGKRFDKGGQEFYLGAIFQPKLGCFYVLTCPASSVVAQVHNRMPVIVKKGEEDAFLDSKLPLQPDEDLNISK